jgi:GxxExxY protein
MALASNDALNNLTWKIIQAAMEVHKQLGPGLLESAYRVCLAYELRDMGLAVASGVQLPLRYKRLSLESMYTMDLVVHNAVVVELKAVEAVLPVHRAQLLTYLKLAGYPAGLLLNFNVPLMKNGVSRVLNPKFRVVTG